MNLKVTKRMISILCALTISTSSIVTSVGAIKAYPGIVVNAEPSADLKNAVDNLNNTLTLSTDTIKTSIKNIEKLSESKKDDNDVSNSLGTVISKLENAIVIINSWNELSIQNVELANTTQKIITGLNLDVLLEETKDINKLASLEKNSNKIFSEIEKVNSQLANENRRLLSDEVRSKASKFKEQITKFRDWKSGNNIINKKDDSTADRRQEAIQCLDSLSNNFDNIKAKRYIELVEQVSKEMIDFQNRFNLKKKYDEFNKKVKEFRVWKDNNHIDKNDDTSVYSRNKAIKYLHEIKQNLDGSKVEQFIKLTEQASKEMIAFQNRFNLDKKYDEFSKKVNEFLTWRDNNHIDKSDDNTVYGRNEALNYHKGIKNDVDGSEVEQFIKLTEQASKEMIAFKNIFNLNKKEVISRASKFKEQVDKFRDWKLENNIITKEEDSTADRRQEAIQCLNSLSNKFNNLKAKKYLELVEQVSKEMIDFQNRFNLNKKYDEFNKKVNEFLTWRGHNNIDEINDTTVHSRNEALNYFNEIGQNLDDSKVKNFDELAKKASKEMIDFQNRFNLQKEYDEFNKKVNEFLAWKSANNIDEIDDSTADRRQEAIKCFNDIKQNFDGSKVEQFIKLTEQASKEMADFQSEFNSVVNDNNQGQLNKLNFRSKLVAKNGEYTQKYNEFQTWKENGHAGINCDEIKELNDKITEQINNLNGQFRTLEYETAQKLIEMIDQAIIKMEELKNKHNKLELKIQIGKIQTKLTEELQKENTSNQLVKQSVEDIVKILENKQFDDYNENLDIILPIIDSLHINQQKKILKKAGEKTVEEYRNFTNEEIQTNKEARVKFMHILSKSIASHVDKTINSLYSNDMTKPVAEYIKNRKNEVVDYYTKMILRSTAYLQYISARKLLEPIDNALNKLQNEYMKSIDKNQVKDLYGFYFNQFLNKISDTEHLYSNYQESKKDFAEFDMLFRNYAKQITRMRSDEEEIYTERGGQVFVRKVDHLAPIRKKYKSLDNLYNEMSYAIQARVQLYMDSIDYPERRKEDEDELKTAIDDARKAFDKFQNCLVLVDNQEFFIIEN